MQRNVFGLGGGHLSLDQVA